MPKTLRYFLRVYKALLWLYPDELRLGYGNDMADVFHEVLQAEWTRRGIRGVTAAGCRALGEVFTVAIPRQLLSDWMITTGLSLAINSAILALLVGILMHGAIRFQ
jgi:hypothetical protein